MCCMAVFYILSFVISYALALVMTHVAQRIAARILRSMGGARRTTVMMS